MKFINLFKCWLFGHTPDPTVTGFITLDEALDLDLLASICVHCNNTIFWDEQVMGWFKW